MPSSYSPILRLELPLNGEQEGTWGNTTNRNIGTLLEQAIAGSATVILVDTDVTLTAIFGGSDEARAAILSIAGAATATRAVIIPAVTKIYVVSNFTSGGQAVVIRTAAGTGVSVGTGATLHVYCDGLNVFLIGGGGAAPPGPGGVTQVNTGPGLTGGPITSTGTISLTTSGVSPGTYGSATSIPRITIDGYGRITGVSVLPATATTSIANGGNSVNTTATNVSIISTGGVSITNPGNLAVSGNMTLGGSITASGGTVAVSVSGVNTRGILWDGTSLIVGRGQPGGSTNVLFFSGDTTTGTATFTVSTVYKTGGGSFTAPSDDRLKRVHGEYLKGLAAILSLKPISFNYNEDPDSVYVGLSAQETLKTDLASMVRTRDDGFLVIDNSELVYTLVNAVKALKENIDDIWTSIEG